MELIVKNKQDTLIEINELINKYEEKAYEAPTPHEHRLAKEIVHDLEVIKKEFNKKLS